MYSMTTYPLRLPLSCPAHHPYSHLQQTPNVFDWGALPGWASPTLWQVESWGSLTNLRPEDRSLLLRNSELKSVGFDRHSLSKYKNGSSCVSGVCFNPSLSINPICHVNIGGCKLLLCLNLRTALVIKSWIWGISCLSHLSASTSMGALPCDQLFAIQAVSNAARKPRAHPVPMGQNGWRNKDKTHQQTSSHPQRHHRDYGCQEVSLRALGECVRKRKWIQGADRLNPTLTPFHTLHAL